MVTGGKAGTPCHVSLPLAFIAFSTKTVSLPGQFVPVQFIPQALPETRGSKALHREALALGSCGHTDVKADCPAMCHVRCRSQGGEAVVTNAPNERAVGQTHRK